MISVIVTCYNQENFIANALKSIENQTYKNWECIIIDDGSTDNSKNVINSFTKKDSRFIYIYQENNGVSKARNTGFKNTKGDYIHFLDGDDTLIENKFELQIQHFNNNTDIDISISNFQHYYINKNKFENYHFEIPKEYPLEQLIYKWQAGFAFPNHSALYKRKIWKENELPFPEDYKGRSEDWVFNILVALKGIKYGYISEVLCNYHIYGSNFTSDIFNSTSSAIQAAYYIKNKLPEKYQHDFIEKVIEKSFQRYLESKKTEILKNSGNWKLGNMLTKPFFLLKKRLSIN